VCYPRPFQEAIIAIPIVLGADYLRLPRESQTWIVEGLLPVGGSMLIFGAAKAGKSFAALQLAACVSSGVEWLGFDAPEPRKAVYIQLDTPRSIWADRVQKLADAGHPVEGVHFGDRETFETHPFDILRDDHAELLRSSVEPLAPGLVVIDTIREAHSGEENDSTAMQQVVARLEAAVKPAALVLVAHARKSQPDQEFDLMNDNRGSNYIVGRMDGIVRFWSNENKGTGGMNCASRTMEQHTLKLRREEEGSWRLDLDERIYGIALEIARANAGSSIRDLARTLAATLPDKSEIAWRAWLRRHLS
jgi:RecA-family ATPase